MCDVYIHAETARTDNQTVNASCSVGDTHVRKPNRIGNSTPNHNNIMLQTETVSEVHMHVCVCVCVCVCLCVCVMHVHILGKDQDHIPFGVLR